MNKLLVKMLAFGVAFSAVASASIVDSELRQWKGKWIVRADSLVPEYKVAHLRRTFELKEKPESFRVKVSADNRFVLYVNGKIAGRGPSRGDIFNWNYETFDIAPFLKSGKNVVAALVWDGGPKRPNAQHSYRLGFILDGETETEDIIATPLKWKMKISAAYSPVALKMYVGQGDRIDAGKFDWGWEQPDFDDSKWRSDFYSISAYENNAGPYGEIHWIVKPSGLPQMESKTVRLREIRRFSGAEKVPDFISGKGEFTVPANTKCTLLLDNGVLTNAYPILTVSKGKGATMKVRYAEALVDAKRQKANRNDIDGRGFNPAFTVSDEFVFDGGDNRTFSPLWYRTYRYVGMDIETKDEPLVIKDYYGDFTGYPFGENGSFKSDDKSIDKIWEVGWRTARLCATETYMDCPYYEQLQYIGDTRIQALISLYVSGDDRLVRQAIRAFNQSRSFHGITKSRYPSRIEQFIPPFSLYWVSMVNDYAKFRNDPEFVREMLGGVRTVLAWYDGQIDPNTGILKAKMPFWNFVDWSESDPATKGDNSTGWRRGIPPEGENAGTAITSLHLALTLREAAQLMTRYGFDEEASEYMRRYERIIKAVYQRCWDAKRGLFADFEGAVSSSQHVNILAILADALPAAEQPVLMKKILEDKSLTQCTFYYRFYLTEAMRKCGMGDLYVSQLEPWRDMIKIGLSTFAENPEPTRSDCHAWSASPNYHLLSLVCGIMPEGYGFDRVSVSPNLGGLGEIHGTVPHPKGDIKVSFRKNTEGKINGTVILPKDLTGDFSWKGVKIPLKSGKNEINIR